MRRITEDVTDLVLEYGGSLSGEHGDGLARSEWNEKMFGPVVYQAFRQVKAAFDPDNLLNPGKIVDAPRDDGQPPLRPRLPAGRAADRLRLRQAGGLRPLGRDVQRQRRLPQDAGRDDVPLVPGHAATSSDSTRGRANALRLAMSGEQPLARAEKSMGPRSLRPVPDVQGVQGGVPQQRGRGQAQGGVSATLLPGPAAAAGPSAHGRHPPDVNRLGAPFAPLVNWLQRPAAACAGCWRSRPASTAAAACRRCTPNHFRRWFARHTPDPAAGRVGRVLLLDDCFTTYNEPAIGRAAVRVLERAGYAVELAGPALLRPADAQQGLPARDAVAGAGAGAGPGAARRGRHADRSAWSRAAC